MCVPPALILPKFELLHPNVKVNVLEGNSSENERRLLSGQVDIAFYSLSESNPRINYHTISSEELLICTCRHHPLRARSRIIQGNTHPCLSLTDLLQERILMMQPV